MTNDLQSAGEFGEWLSSMRVALRGEGASDVPCGSCTACCTSSQFVHIEPDETATLARIPAELLFPAPRMPKGHVLLGYDQRGHCPMLVDGQCSIYDDRPRTCRVYDCRVFAAAGLTVDDDESAIDRQVRRWHFDHATDADRVHHDAVEAAAAFLAEHATDLGDDAPRSSIGRAIAAVESYELFVRAGDDGRAQVVLPSVADVRVEFSRRRR